MKLRSFIFWNLYFIEMVMCFTKNLRHPHISSKTYQSLLENQDSVAANDNWDKFVKHHVGRWCGIQSCHYHLDEEESSSSDRILCGTLLTLQDQSIDHTNFFVSSPGNFEATERIPSENILLQKVATYEKPTLSSKVCGNVAMGGPGMSREGLSIQFSFSHNDARMRVMIAYEPSDFVTVPSTSIQIPSSMSMSDITISREKRLADTESSATLTSLPPLRDFTEAVPHFLFSKPSIEKDFGGDFAGVKEFYRKSDGPVTATADDATRRESQIVPLAPLPFYEDYLGNLQSALKLLNAVEKKDDDDEDDDMDFVKIFDGGLLIEAPLVILAGDETDVKMSWSVPTTTDLSTSRTVYIAEATFTAMNDVINKTRRKRRGDTFVDQPLLLDFSVQTLVRE